MNKTLYIRDEDVALWDRAKELAGDKLSPVIVEALKKFVAEKEAEPKGFRRIEVRYEDADDRYLPKAKAFYGRWIFPPSKPLAFFDEADERNDLFAIATTQKGAAVFLTWCSDAQRDKFAERFYVYDSFDEAAINSRLNLAARKTIETIGVPVEELDI